MASITPRADGGYRVQLSVKGQRDSATFKTKKEAQQWAGMREAELLRAAELPIGKQKTLADALDEYGRVVSPQHQGKRWELLRFTAFKENVEHKEFPAQKRLADVTVADLAAWRDSRMKVVSAGTVLREMNLVGSVLEVARREWGWIAVNPLEDVRKPQAPDHRERVLLGYEVRGMLRSLRYAGGPVRSVSQAVAVAMLLALATGMRAGELCGLTWANVKGTYCRLPRTKNGSARNVPLSTVALKLIERCRGWDPVLVLGVQSQTLDALYRRARQRAGLSGFTFHDTRHTSATMMAKKVDALSLCKIFGWKNVSMALVYYNPTASQLAARLG